MSEHDLKPATTGRGSRKRRVADDEEKQTRRRALIAHLVADQGIEESKVADVLCAMFGISVARCTVTRDLQWARRHGWIVTHLGEDCPGREHLDAVKQTAHFYDGLQKALQEGSGGTLRALHVFWSGPCRADEDDGWDGRLQRFSKRASPTLLDLLARAERIGVTWGRTIGENIEAVAAATSRGQIKPQPNVTIVPTSGEPLGGARAQFASTDLAERLSAILGGSNVPSLRGISPVIPEEFRGHDHATVLRFIRGLRSFREVFGDAGAAGIVAQLDTVLTSAGSFGERYHAFQNEFVRIPGLSREKLGELALGDVGGVLIQKDGGFSKAQQKAFAALRDLWTGIRIDDFRRVSASARENGRPGVILSAVGANKADITLALTCRERLVNHLIIDETLATRLSELVNRAKIAAA